LPASEASGDHCLHDGKQILSAMLYFVRQQLVPGLRLLALRNVARDF